jgi:acyl transferase domain-containing protein
MAARDQSTVGHRQAVAIVGMSCRFPGGKDVDGYWESLKAGRDSVSTWPGADAGPQPPAGPAVSGARGFLTDIDAFDADFFQLSRREAEFLNPQHRIFLECAWHALEDAGYDAAKSAGVVAVYAACGFNSYHQLVQPQVRSPAEDLLAYISNGPDFLPTRVSHKLNLTGESIAVQTACSSSLVAVHLACRSLLNGDCTLALAGGANIGVPGSDQDKYQEGMIFAPDGRCRSFDHRANGMVSADGVGIVVLKRLDQALADGDHIYAVIAGSALNNDGSDKVSYPAPSISGQAEVIATAVGLAGITADAISYVEAHGTGTALGDPIEIAALTRAFRFTTDRRGYCALGTVKTNIGHAIHSAGIAGLIKVVLALHHRLIPPSLHFEKPNPEIDFENSPFFVNTACRPWPSGGATRRAGVSSFGVGGTNAHVIVEEAPAVEAAPSTRSAHLLVLSAKTPVALDAASRKLAACLEVHPELNIADVAFTLQTGRREFALRRAVTCRDRGDAVAKLNSADPATSPALDPRDRAVTFVFPGIGSQHVNMGRELYATHPDFRRDVDRGCECLMVITGRDLRSVLYSSDPKCRELLDDAALSQPAIFIIEHALARLWQSFGIEPAAVVGHSVGEYAAACIAGVLSFEDALLLVATRARMIADLPRGAMLALPLSVEELTALLPDRAWIAIVNGPAFCVVAGEPAAIRKLEVAAAAKRIFTSRLAASHAVHTEMMRPIEAAFAEVFNRIATREPKLRILSGSTGQWLRAADVQNASYWAAHLSEPVNFSRALDRLFEEPDAILLEVGPSTMMSGLARLHPSHRPTQLVVSSLPSGQDSQTDWQALSNAVGELWSANLPIDWTAFQAHERRRRVPLPGYCFERSRYWIRRDDAEASAPPGTAAASEKLSRVSDWLHRPVWKRTRLPAGYCRGDLAMRSGVCLVLAMSDRLTGGIEQEIRDSGQTVVAVRPGTFYSEIAPGRIAIAPTQPADYQELLRRVEDNFGAVQTILLFADAENDQDRNADNNQQLSYAYCSLLLLAQALGGRTQPVDLWIISQDGHAVPGCDGELHVGHALLFGLARVIPQESPHVTVRCVDFASRESDDRARSARLLAELADPSDEPEIAYRARDRWVCGSAPLQCDHDAKPSLLAEGGVCVIVGGLGHVGLCLAEALAEIAGVKLALVSRGGLPPAEQWDALRADASLPPDMRRKLDKVAALRARDAAVEIYAGDIADRIGMLGVMKTIQKRQGRILGIVHAAGIVDPAHLKFIGETTTELSKELFRPHVAGSEALGEIVDALQPRFCVMCSSLSSLVGGLSYGAHAAGHRFMDAVVQRQAMRHSNCTKWMTINYDTWLVPSRDAGLGAGESHLHILAAEGAEVLLHTLSAGESQVLVSTVSLETRVARLRRFFSAAATPGLSVPRQPDTAQVANPAALATDELEEVVLGLFREVLGDRRIAPDGNFFAFGGTSLSMLDAISRVNHRLGIRIPLVKGFRALSATAMAELAWGELQDAQNVELVS